MAQYTDFQQYLLDKHGKTPYMTAKEPITPVEPQQQTGFSLTPEQIQTLKASGISDEEISNYIKDQNNMLANPQQTEPTQQTQPTQQTEPMQPVEPTQQTEPTSETIANKVQSKYFNHMTREDELYKWITTQYANGANTQAIKEALSKSYYPSIVDNIMRDYDISRKFNTKQNYFHSTISEFKKTLQEQYPDMPKQDIEALAKEFASYKRNDMSSDEWDSIKREWKQFYYGGKKLFQSIFFMNQDETNKEIQQLEFEEAYNEAESGRTVDIGDVFNPFWVGTAASTLVPGGLFITAGIDAALGTMHSLGQGDSKQKAFLTGGLSAVAPFAVNAVFRGIPYLWNSFRFTDEQIKNDILALTQGATKQEKIDALKQTKNVLMESNKQGIPLDVSSITPTTSSTAGVTKVLKSFERETGKQTRPELEYGYKILKNLVETDDYLALLKNIDNASLSKTNLLANLAEVQKTLKNVENERWTELRNLLQNPTFENKWDSVDFLSMKGKPLIDVNGKNITRSKDVQEFMDSYENYITQSLENLDQTKVNFSQLLDIVKDAKSTLLNSSKLSREKENMLLNNIENNFENLIITDPKTAATYAQAKKATLNRVERDKILFDLFQKLDKKDGGKFSSTFSQLSVKDLSYMKSLSKPEDWVNLKQKYLTAKVSSSINTDGSVNFKKLIDSIDDIVKSDTKFTIYSEEEIAKFVKSRDILQKVKNQFDIVNSIPTTGEEKNLIWATLHRFSDLLRKFANSRKIVKGEKLVEYLDKFINDLEYQAKYADKIIQKSKYAKTYGITPMYLSNTGHSREGN